MGGWERSVPSQLGLAGTAVPDGQCSTHVNSRQVGSYSIDPAASTAVLRQMSAPDAGGDGLGVAGVAMPGPRPPTVRAPVMAALLVTFIDAAGWV